MIAGVIQPFSSTIECRQIAAESIPDLIISDVEIYGNGTAKTSYINWIVDYEKQLGITATENITSRFKNPLSLKITFDEEVDWNFQVNPVLELDVTFSVRNLFEGK